MHGRWPRLEHPVTFVCRSAERWPDLFSGSEQPVLDPDELHGRIKTNEDCWIVMPFLHLKRSGVNVSISPRPIPAQICVISALDLGIRDFTYNSFLVGCRSDGPKPVLCDFSVVQNHANAVSEREAFIPHWPQPGLIPRPPGRAERVENVVFKGSESNLHESFRSPEFLSELGKLGVRLQIDGRPESGPVAWHDYSQADLVLAVRDLTEKDALVKPASKLTNAWLAGTPALLGPEPAFRDLRRSDLDYIEVRSPREASEAIRRLKEQPQLYRQMVQNGLERGKEFTADRVAARWHEVLSGPVCRRYERWKKRFAVSRLGGFMLRAIGQRLARARSDYDREHGPRLITGRVP